MNAAVVPAGRPDTEKSMGEPKPPETDVTTVAVAVPPWKQEIEEGSTVTVKSGPAWGTGPGRVTPNTAPAKRRARNMGTRLTLQGYYPLRGA